MALIALIFTALGTAIASVLEDMHGFQLIMNFLVMPIFFLSGALFPLENLPKVLNVIVKFNPLSYGVDGIRATLNGVSQFGLMTDFWVLAIVFAVFISIGSYLFSRIQI
jgi:ABC-2 type transport system permease protein